MAGIALLALGVLLVVYQIGQAPAPSGATPFQPQAPYTAAFFYPWYPSHWSEGGINPYTNYTPSLGYYSSSDDEIIAEQLELADRSHLEVLISSWWEPGEVTDVNLQHILSVTEDSDSPIRWSTYYEREGYSNPTAAQIAADVQHLASLAFSSPAYLRIDGRPVLFVYGDGGDGCAMVNRWAQAEALSGVDVYVVLKVFYGYQNCSTQPDSWHQYSPASAFDYQPPYSVSVSPGFAIKGQPPVLTRDIARFETGVQWMALSGATWQLITTWNEWAEGTAVEPAAEYGEVYVDILCRNLPGTTPCATPSTPTAPSSQTPGPTPTVTPTPPAGPTVAPTTTPTSPPATVQPTPSSSQAGPTPTMTGQPAPTPSHAGPGLTPTVTPPAVGTPTPTPTPVPPAPGKPPKVKRGDVDCNGTVNSVDALDVLLKVNGKPDKGSCAIVSSVGSDELYDVDCDGFVRATDGLRILRFVAGMPMASAVSCPPIGSEGN